MEYLHMMSATVLRVFHGVCCFPKIQMFACHQLASSFNCLQAWLWCVQILNLRKSWLKQATNRGMMTTDEVEMGAK